MDYKDLLKEIKSKNIKSLYLFYGQEYFLANIMIKLLIKTIVNPTYEQLNVVNINGSEALAQDIINACETVPFLDQYRVVIVRDYSLLQVGNVSSSQVDVISNYIKNIPSTTALIFTNKKIDKRKKLFKNLIEKSFVVEYSKLKKTDLEKWIRKKIKQKGKIIQGDALLYFIEKSTYLNRHSEKNLEDIENEIDKLVNFIGDKKEITIKDLDIISPNILENDVFKMLDLIGQNNIDQALILLNNLFKDGEPALRIFSLVVRQLRNIFKCKLLREKGFAAGEISKQIGIPSFASNKLLRQCSNYTYDRLRELFNNAAELDYKMKTGRINQNLALELFINNFISK